MEEGSAKDETDAFAPSVKGDDEAAVADLMEKDKMEERVGGGDTHMG